MDKESRLIQKVKRLIRRLGCPRWLHHYGPKTYEFFQHLCALLVRYFCQLSYVRVKQLFDLLGIVCPSKSALQYTSAKIKSLFWEKALKATSGTPYLIAIDSTGFSRSNPSYHYLRRINGQMPRVSVKLSAAFDTRRKKYCAAKIRVLPAHDIRDVKHLLKNCQPKVLVADRAYDANWLHEYCKDHNIQAHIPIRKWGKPRHKSFGARIQAQKHYNNKTYHRREIAESGNSSIKRKYGSSIRSKKVRTIRTEIYGRLTCHNLFSYFTRLLG